jgi:hypothetical protein
MFDILSGGLESFHEYFVLFEGYLQKKSFSYKLRYETEENGFEHDHTSSLRGRRVCVSSTRDSLPVVPMRGTKTAHYPDLSARPEGPRNTIFAITSLAP